MTAERPPKPRVHHLVQAPVKPLDQDGVVVGGIGTVVFALATLLLLLFRGWLNEHDVQWWLWTGLAGTLLGIVGTAYCVRRKVVRERAESASLEAEPPTAADRP